MGYTMPAEGRNIGFPSKEKIVVKVPFSNEEYDFSGTGNALLKTSHNEPTLVVNALPLFA
ncbi:hypothetical protein ACFMB7_22795 [Bacillus toyonensis]